MKLIAVFVMMVCAVALASDESRGTVPREGPNKYAGHAEQNGMGVGATMLTNGEVHKVFKTDVTRCCLVVEVALYPQKDVPTEVSMNDFTLRIVGQDIAARPSSPKVVAWHSSQDRDRVRPTLIRDMEQELTEKSLPPGNTSGPVSGYLYFSFSEKVKKAKYQLEYTLNGNKLVMALN